MKSITASLALLSLLTLAACTEVNPTAVYTEAGTIVAPDQGSAGADLWSGDGPPPADAARPGDGPTRDGPKPPPRDGAPPPPDKGTTTPKCTAPTNRALRVFFIGNSFTQGGPVPTLFKSLAASAGWPTPHVEYSAYGGYTLSKHKSTSSSTGGVAKGSWDFVVLQEYSTGPTDNAGNPGKFKADATWWYDQVKAKSPKGWVVLYETWARHKDHSYYPKTFKDPAQMQAQLRKHYNDAAKSYIPKHSKAAAKNHVKVAPCGDAWEKHLNGPNPLRLHASDDYHAGNNGTYLNAAVIYSTIYGCRAKGLDSLGRADAGRLQDAADATTGKKGIPPGKQPGVFPVGTKVQVDFGTLKTNTGNWNNVTSTSGSLSNAVSSTGKATDMDLAITDSFSGGNTSGRPDNKLNLPKTVSQDNLYCGSSYGHSSGMKYPAAFELRDLAPGVYSVSLFPSRAGKDGSRDRKTRYTIGGAHKDVDATDNTSNVATFPSVTVGKDGKIKVGVAVSPAGNGRYCYLNAMLVERTK